MSPKPNFESDALNQWLTQPTHKSPEVQARVFRAFRFLQTQYPAKNPGSILSELKCIDFSHPVELPSLSPGTVLVGFKDPRVSPYRSAYFTKSGYPVGRLGVADHSRLRTNQKTLDKVQNRYEVIVAIPVGEVLESICAPAEDKHSMALPQGQKPSKGARGILAAGGALQYLIPRMTRYLRYVARMG